MEKKLQNEWKLKIKKHESCMEQNEICVTELRQKYVRLLMGNKKKDAFLIIIKTWLKYLKVCIVIITNSSVTKYISFCVSIWIST